MRISYAIVYLFCVASLTSDSYPGHSGGAAVVEGPRDGSRPLALRRANVSGNATLRVAPDEAFITFTITSQQPTAAQAKTIVTDATRSVMGRVLEVEGVTEENVSTDSLQLQPRWESRRRFDGTYETKITGYEASAWPIAKSLCIFLTKPSCHATVALA